MKKKKTSLATRLIIAAVLLIVDFLNFTVGRFGFNVVRSTFRTEVTITPVGIAITALLLILAIAEVVIGFKEMPSRKDLEAEN